ncbi:MAG: glutathione synthase [Hominimerdicola sp.]
MTDNKYIFEGGFGLERETLRVTADGRLSQTPHPFTDSLFERDFCENQLEIITPVCDSIDQAMEELGRLSSEAEELLEQKGEYLWLYSNPPYFESEDEIPVARFSGEKSYKSEYRINLERRYGKRLMLYSGIHFNFSFSQRFLNSVYSGGNFRDFKDDLYLKLFKYASRYSWLLVLLNAASPVYDKSLENDGLSGTGFDGYSSRRNGKKGYWNRFIPKLDYSSIDKYVASVRRYINTGALLSEGELYLPVRLKPCGENSLESLEKNGADHIELRMFDINPLSLLGIFAEDLEFAHYFLVYLLSLPDFEFSLALQMQAIANHKAAAEFDISQIKINGYPAVQAALGLLEDMRIYFAEYPHITEIIDFQKEKLFGSNRYSDEVYRIFHNDFQNSALKKFTSKGERNVCVSCLAQV